MSDEEIIDSLAEAAANAALETQLLRDKEYHSQIKSYYIKTIFLWELDKEPNKFLRWTFADTFMTALNIVHDYIGNFEIKFFWNEKLNLLDDCKKVYLSDYKNRLAKTIKRMESAKEVRDIYNIFHVDILEHHENILEYNPQISEETEDYKYWMLPENFQLYDDLENGLQIISGNYVRISRDAERRNNALLHKVLQCVIGELKKNPLFNALYSTAFFGGSYYDGLKVSNPDEYDIDLLLNLPALSYPIINRSVTPGYVEVKIDMTEIDRQVYLFDFRGLGRLLDNGYLDINRTNRWFQSIMQFALNRIDDDDFTLIMRNSGPAMTLTVCAGAIQFDIDLVPCFNFNQQMWPVGFKKSNLPKGYFIVPKPIPNIEQYSKKWRTSFQEHEGPLLTNIGRIKPALKLLKVLRDKENFVDLRSYFIKNVFLLYVPGKEDFFCHKSLSYTFMTMLILLKEYIANRCIPFYWDESRNLLQISDKHAENIENRLARIIRDLERDPNSLYKVFGSPRFVQLFGSPVSVPSSESSDDEAPGTSLATTEATGWGTVAGVAGILGAIGALGLGLAYVNRRNNNNRN